MAQHGRNALAVAEFLQAHPGCEKVIYPGLQAHPQHALAKRQMHGFGGMVVFYVRGGLAETNKVLESFKLFALAESLGAVESLAERCVAVPSCCCCCCCCDCFHLFRRLTQHCCFCATLHPPLIWQSCHHDARVGAAGDTRRTRHQRQSGEIKRGYREFAGHFARS